jgi:small subunit ribosomal protein S21e
MLLYLLLIKRQNEKEILWLAYIPKENVPYVRLINSKDHAIQLNVCDVDASGKIVLTSKVYAISGSVKGLVNLMSLITNRLAAQDGYLKNVWSYSK